MICYLDLDNFKPINDRWGHAAGDRVLIEVARRLETCLRESDTVSRIGGDEFVLLLPGIDAGPELNQVLERLLDALNAPLTVNGGTARVSCSLGLALFPHDAEDADTLLRYADQAMYNAKAAGRDRYVRFDSREMQQSNERQSRLQAIVKGLENHEFVLFYQPKVDLRDGSLIGVEALVRWQHPEHGLLPPGEFLGFVIDSDCEIRFWEFVLETAAIKDVNLVLLALSQCRSIGVQVSLDDFGTGYSSLTLFRRLPVDTLKIDQSFVRDMLGDADDRSIVESFVHMARAFKRNVVAEGVETMEHARALLEMGCFQVQGYGIARPTDADALPAWIRGWQQQRAWEALAPAKGGWQAGRA